MPEEGGAQTFTVDDDMEDEDLPGEGEQMMPGSICPLCSSTNTQTGRKDQQPGQFECTDCGVAYSYSVNVEVLNPETLVSEEDVDSPEAPELPVAASIAIDRNSLNKIASAEKKGFCCPACGSRDLKIAGSGPSRELDCQTCGTHAKREFMIDVDSPDYSELRISWTLDPAKRKCQSCAEPRKKFASDIAFGKMLKSASSAEFPRDKAVAWINRHYGKSAVVNSGPFKGEPLAETVASQLARYGLRKAADMKALAEVQIAEDDMDICIRDQKGKGYTLAESKNICGCLKEASAGPDVDNVYMAAFAGKIEDSILRKMADHDSSLIKKNIEVKASDEDLNVDIADLPEMSNEDEVLDKEALFEDKEPAEASSDEVEIHLDASTGEFEVKTAKGLDRVDDVIGEVDVPKGSSPIKHENPVPNKSPDVPTGDAHMGKEKESIPAGEELDVPVDSSYIRNEEQVGDSISNKTLGVVASDTDGVGKPKMSDDLGVKNPSNKSLDQVEDIECCDDVPRSDAHMGHEEKIEGRSPDVPRSDAQIRNEEKITAVDPVVPSQDGDTELKMRGREASQQEQRLVEARRQKAVRLAAKMAASGAIKDAEFEQWVDDLSAFPLERMEAIANKMIQASSEGMQKTASTLTTPVVIEGSYEDPEPPSLLDKLASAFTFGNKKSSRYIKEDLHLED
jgi:Zn finger protein HypA/HybF involved in hydrogenase expression